MLSPNIEANFDPNLIELVRQVNSNHSAIGLSVDGQQQAVMLSLEAFKQLISGRIGVEQGQLSESEFRQQFQQALVEAGFDTREKIIDLVREVKRDVAAEYIQTYTHMHHTPLVSDL
jgi:hypothetical protein